MSDTDAGSAGPFTLQARSARYDPICPDDFAISPSAPIALDPERGVFIFPEDQLVRTPIRRPRRQRGPGAIAALYALLIIGGVLYLLSVALQVAIELGRLPS